MFRDLPDTAIKFKLRQHYKYTLVHLYQTRPYMDQIPLIAMNTKYEIIQINLELIYV
jgi:hypothetical protein